MTKQEVESTLNEIRDLLFSAIEFDAEIDFKDSDKFGDTIAAQDLFAEATNKAEIKFAALMSKFS